MTTLTDDDTSVDFDAVDKEVAKGKANGAAEPEVEISADSEAPAADKEILKPDAGLEKLRNQLETEKTAREAAERRAQDASKAEVEARTESQESQLHLVTNAIESLSQKNLSLRASYAEAMAVQDYDKVAEINDTIAENHAKLLQLKNGKERIEKQPKPVARVAPDPVEQFAGQLTPKSASWIRAHPEMVTNPIKNRKMLAAHEIAMADGIEADSAEYFQSIENTMGLTRAAAPPPPPEIPDVDPMQEAAKPSARKSPPAAAPVSRSGNGAAPRNNRVTLSPDEREMARLNNQTDEEYASNKMALIKEGKIH